MFRYSQKSHSDGNVTPSSPFLSPYPRHFSYNSATADKKSSRPFSHCDRLAPKWKFPPDPSHIPDCKGYGIFSPSSPTPMGPRPWLRTGLILERCIVPHSLLTLVPNRNRSLLPRLELLSVLAIVIEDVRGAPSLDDSSPVTDARWTHNTAAILSSPPRARSPD